MLLLIPQSPTTFSIAEYAPSNAHLGRVFPSLSSLLSALTAIDFIDVALHDARVSLDASIREAQSRLSRLTSDDLRMLGITPSSALLAYGRHLNRALKKEPSR